MRRRSVMVRSAVVAMIGSLSAALASCSQPAAPAAAHTPASIAPLPERGAAGQTADADLSALERCIAAGQCQRVHTETFSNATIEIYQQSSELPAVHVVTTYADGQPTVWSLKEEHAASFLGLTCGLANCLLDVVVGPETRASIDMRMVSHALTGRIEGAAVGPALSTQAVDLDADGVLDLVSAKHLVQSDGTELFYYQTYLNDDRQLTTTGCTAPSTDATPPTALQTRTCP
ncbi:hypothetical protein [Cumulibacter manganitolerans]|uniref:hypothetical protein n=1 Tax=Cumulibacter manganitolerans TaxID=1884992 RepID=UPI0012972CEF|nr:hypothetical protein [Cumulibacter manganitolerans]